MTAVLLIAVACALTGCGRKGNLDLPPGNADYQGAPAPANETGATSPPSASSAQRDLFDPTANNDKSIIAPKGPKKRIILDPILD